MSQIYRLHFAPDNASVIIRIMLEEMRLPYEAVLVDRAAQAQRSASYLALNPLGMIPALETPDGALFETAAIALWLSDRHQSELLPDPSSPARGDALKWLFFLSNTLHAGLRQMFYPEKYVGADHAEALRDGLADNIRRDFARIDGLIADPACTVLGGDALGFLDIYACTLFRWAQLYPKDYAANWACAADYPALRALATKVETRPSVRAAILAEGLGPAPFSDPIHATPPIGSAT